MIKKSISIFLVFVTCTILTGCGNQMKTLENQIKLLNTEMSKKPADKYEDFFDKNSVYVHLHEMKKHELSKYYNETGSNLYDVYYAVITNKSDKNVVLSVPDTYVTTKSGRTKVIGNNLKSLMKKGDRSIMAKTGNATGMILLSAITWGLAAPALLTQGDSNESLKAKEIYYQTTYDKGLQSAVIPPYYTVVGIVVLPDKPFHSYKSVNFKFQQTKKMEYFDIEYPIYYADGKAAKDRRKKALKEAEFQKKAAELKRKEEEKKRKEQLKLMKQKHKNL